MTYPTGESYEGEFEDDEMSGFGKYTDPNKNIEIEGEFEKSMLNGEAVTTSIKEGTTVKGVYKNGLKNGFFEVKRTIKDKVVEYRGEFKNDKEHPFNKEMSSRI